LTRLKERQIMSDESKTGGGRAEPELNSYLQALAEVLEDCVASGPPGASQDLMISGKLTPGSRLAELHILVEAQDGPEKDVLRPLLDRINAIPAPEARHGPIAFRLVFALWGGSNDRPFSA
jgi:hypothetical protein